MRIGFDTLIENPHRPSSAINYLKVMLSTLARLSPADTFVVFVSRENRKHFDFRAPNIELVECLASNENIPARILAQQIQYPVLLRRHGVDVLHALNQIPLVTRVATVCKVCTLHHHVAPDEFSTRMTVSLAVTNRLRRVYRRRVLDWSARRATLVMANSHATRELIIKHMGVPEDRIEVVYESVDDRFAPAEDLPTVRGQVEARFVLRRNYLLYVSNLWFYKNPDGAIRAFAEQRRRYADDLDLVVVGNDDYGRTPSLAKLAADEGVADRVRFLGKVPFDDLIRLYQAAHVVFYPSLAETFGKPVVEGMRCGVPVATSTCSSLPELAAGAALLFDPNDPVAMANALHVATTDEDTRSRLRAAGLKRGEDFSWEETARGTLAMCQRAVKRSRDTA
jgi:glycosyltransferase involved in cell wall biosynthesis